MAHFLLFSRANWSDLSHLGLTSSQEKIHIAQERTTAGVGVAHYRFTGAPACLGDGVPKSHGIL